jgi:type IV pilus assembly protein PilQ
MSAGFQLAFRIPGAFCRLFRNVKIVPRRGGFMFHRVFLLIFLLPLIAFSYTPVKTGHTEWSGEPFTFDFKDIDIKDLFRFIADISGLNVILDPSVKGSVTLKLTDVPWDQALDLITRNQGLGYSIEGNVIRIAPYAKFEQELAAQRRIEQEEMLNAPMITKIIRLSYSKAADMELIVKKFLTAKGSTIVDRRTNTLIITDVETNDALWGFTAVTK